MERASARTNSYNRHKTYGSLAYAETAARPLERGGGEVLRPQPKVRPRERAAVRPKVQVREAEQVSVFAVVGFLAVGVFAILLMLSAIQLAVVGDNIVSLKNQLTGLESEEAKLLAQYELAYDLSGIAQKAGEAGMVKPQSDQLYTLDLSEADSVIHYDQKADAGQDGGGALHRLRELLEETLSYLRP